MKHLQRLIAAMLVFPTAAFAVEPWYRESPSHRERRTLNSPSLYASPYPAGGLYTWRQYYYGRFHFPYYGRSRHPVFDLLPYSPELSMTKSWIPERDTVPPAPDDPITRLQRNAFTDDAHTPEQLQQLRLGY